MSCKHKCKCKKQPVLVIMRYGDELLPWHPEHADYEFEYMTVDLNDPGFPELVKKRLKCMCKKYGCKPDVVSAIFNLTAELRLAQCVLFIRRFYTSSMDNLALRRTLGAQLQSFYVRRGKERYAPTIDSFSDLGYKYVATPEHLKDPIMAQMFVAVQPGSKIKYGTGPDEQEETLRVDAGLGNFPFVNDMNIVSPCLESQAFKGAKFIDIDSDSKIRLPDGIMVNAATQKILGTPNEKNRIFAAIAGYTVDTHGTLRSRRVDLALESFAYNQTRNPVPML